jgi:hypothetical protein
MPHKGLQRHDQSQSRDSRLPDQLHVVPHHHELDLVNVQSLFGVPADGRARNDSMRLMPREQQLHNAADRLLWMPLGELQFDNEPASRNGRVPDDLRNMP